MFFAPHPCSNIASNVSAAFSALRSGLASALTVSALVIAPGANAAIVFSESFDGPTLDPAKWLVSALRGDPNSPYYGTNHPAIFYFAGGRLLAEVPGGANGGFGIPDGSRLQPNVVVAGNFEITFRGDEALRESIGGNKDNSGFSLVAGNVSITIAGNYSPSTSGQSHRVVAYNGAANCINNQTLSAASLYAAEFRISRLSGAITIAYRLNGGAWASVSCGTYSASFTPWIDVYSGDGGGTRQNGRFTASVDYFIVSDTPGAAIGGNGTCGNANGSTRTVAPTATSELCASGTPSAVNSFGRWSWSCYGFGAGATATCSALMQPTVAVTPTKREVVEYYVKGINKYFLTARSAEQAALDALPNAFVRTGTAFAATDALNAAVGASPICRAYHDPVNGGTNSHFYGGPTDCATLQAANLKEFTYEGEDFAVRLPAFGACPAAGYVPIYRLFRATSSNHRYVTSQSLVDTLALGEGWINEGVAFCSTEATSAAKPLFGRAIYGAALAGGTVTVKTPTSDFSTTVMSDGRYLVPAPGAGPFRIRATGNTDRVIELYSYTNNVGYVNVNPMTSAVLYNATKLSPRQSFVLADKTISDSQLQVAESQVQQYFGKTLLTNGIVPGAQSFFSSPFLANRHGMDGVLDSVSVAISDEKLIVMPAGGLPKDLLSYSGAFTPTPAQVKDATLIAQIFEKLNPGAKDAEDAMRKTIDEMILRKQVDTYFGQGAAGSNIYVLRNVGKDFLIAKTVDAFKVVLLNMLSSTALITKDERDFLSLLDDATLGASFLTPYINLASGRDGSDGLELRIVDAFDKTRPGQWLLDTNRATQDTRGVIRWLSACPLPTRVWESILLWDSSKSECTVANLPPRANISTDADVSKEGGVVTLDGSQSSDPDGNILFHHWNISFQSGSGEILAIDKDKPIAYLFASKITSDTQVVVTLKVTDGNGVSNSQLTTILFGKAAVICQTPQVLQNGVCVSPIVSCVLPQVLQNGVCVIIPTTCTLPQILQNGVCITPPLTCTPPQVPQGFVCVTPQPTCVPPTVLQNGVCITPQTNGLDRFTRDSSAKLASSECSARTYGQWNQLAQELVAYIAPSSNMWRSVDACRWVMNAVENAGLTFEQAVQTYKQSAPDAWSDGATALVCTPPLVSQNGVCVVPTTADRCTYDNINATNFFKINLGMSYEQVLSAIGCKADGVAFEAISHKTVAWIATPDGTSSRIIWVHFDPMLAHVIALPPEELFGSEEFPYKSRVGF